MKRRDFIKWNTMAAAAAATPAILDYVGLDKVRSFYSRPKAKSVVVLYMVGGPSQIELFDYKPDLYKYAGKTLGHVHPNPVRALKTSPIIPPMRKFQQYGQCGQWVSEFFPNIATIVDDLAMIKCFTAKEDNHTQAQMEFCTGVTFPGQPFAGAWLNYGLNQKQGKLPKSFLLTDPKGHLRIGDLAWKTEPLPSSNTMFKFADPNRTLQLLRNARTDQEFIELFEEMNKFNSSPQGFQALSKERREDFNLIYSMREPIMDILDLTKLTSEEEKLYGLEDPLCKSLGEQLIVARRLVEQEVPFIKVFCGNNVEAENWDHHVNIKDIIDMAHKADRPIAGFMKDMKQRGLLDEAAVVWAGEFGREPAIDPDRPNATGRPHNIYGGTIWMAGAGIKKGISIGETDELSWRTVSNSVEMGDVWATLFHLMGVDHQSLSFPSKSGAEMRLTRSYHRVIKEILT